MKRLAVPALCLVLAGCGFHPMYGRTTGPALASVFVEPVAERDGFELRNALIDALQSDGEEHGKAYHLKITLNENAQGIALQNDATITRYNNTLTAHYTLYDTQGKELTSGTQTQMSAYNVVQSPYATQVAAQDSSKRAAQDIAERIHLDLGVWFRQHKK
ncbi:MAG TPA: LPS assembly lipoprotein LptE [Rhizomicrobium sp.]|nr:LPS assembly lipoprotein LptE [Rhizomicrobium sp.]